MEKSGSKWDILGMFRGITPINLDAKGRMAIPMRYRTQLTEDENQIVVTIDTNTACLLLYPLPEWEVIEQKLAALPSFNEAARRIQRLLIGHATELDIDSNGRVLLPNVLRDYANLDKKIVLVGQGKKFEIWSHEAWEQARDGWLDLAKTEDKLPEELTTLAL